MKKGNAEFTVFGVEWQLMNLESWMEPDYERPFQHALKCGLFRRWGGRFVIEDFAVSADTIRLVCLEENL